MKGDLNRLRIFVASPGEVEEERSIVTNVVGELRRTFEKNLPFSIDVIRWETHAWPAVGEDAQDVINQEIGEYDIFVGIMWKRFGTPTKRARSGTDEEFQRAYEYFKTYKRPHIMFYFRTTPFYSTDIIDHSQFEKVILFRNELRKLGVLFWEYDQPIEFERYVRQHLTRQILPYISPDPISEEIPKESKMPQGVKSGPLSVKDKQALSKRLKIFLAYSHVDRKEVIRLYEDLRLGGFYPWIDTENLLPGQMWHRVIDETIKRSNVIVLCLSSTSVLKTGFFDREFQLALREANRNKSSPPLLVAIRLEKVSIPSEIKTIQYVDYFQTDGPAELVEVLRTFEENR